MDKGEGVRLRFEFSSDVGIMNIIFDCIEGFLRASGLDPEKLWKETLALREVVTNAIIHGNLQDPAKQVVLEMERREDSLVFRVKDQGQGFDFDRFGKEPSSMEEILAQRGRGLFIAKSVMDRIEYKFEGGSIIIMEKRL